MGCPQAGDVGPALAHARNAPAGDQKYTAESAKSRHDEATMMADFSSAPDLTPGELSSGLAAVSAHWVAQEKRSP
jgi:hypothetical protein